MKRIVLTEALILAMSDFAAKADEAAMLRHLHSVGLIAMWQKEFDERAQASRLG